MVVNVLLAEESHMAKPSVEVGGDYMRAYAESVAHPGLPTKQSAKKGWPRIPQLLNGTGGIWTQVCLIPKSMPFSQGMAEADVCGPATSLLVR